MFTNSIEVMEKMIKQLDTQGVAFIEGKTGCGKQALMKELVKTHYPKQKTLVVRSTSLLSTYPEIKDGEIIQKNALTDVDILLLEEVQLFSRAQIELVLQFVSSGKKVIFLLDSGWNNEELYNLTINDLIVEPIQMEIR